MLASSDATCVVRRARREWRCICAEPVKGWEVKATVDKPEGEDGVAELTFRVRIGDDPMARATDTETSGRRQGVLFKKIEITPVPNPNYKPDCLGDIHVGDIYVEYLGEAAAWESGTRYCSVCALNTWEGVKAS